MSLDSGVYSVNVPNTDYIPKRWGTLVVDKSGAPYNVVSYYPTDSGDVYTRAFSSSSGTPSWYTGWIRQPSRTEVDALSSRLSVQGVGDMDEETIGSLVPKILEKMTRNGTVYLFKGPWTNHSNGYSCIAFRIAYSDDVNRYTGLVVSYDGHAWLFTANSTALSNPVIITLA